jgi:hypothetical protein
MSPNPGRGTVIKRSIAALVLALMAVPVGATAASAVTRTDKVDCLFYQTFRERDVTDIAACFLP